METNQKRKLKEEYKNRCPEMGVISFVCSATGEAFLGISQDTKADFNSNRAKLAAGSHPNKRMQELWEEYGENAFECSVLKVLKYEDPHQDHKQELEKLRESCLANDPKARRIWR